jgi:hypothetical protein
LRNTLKPKPENRITDMTPASGTKKPASMGDKKIRMKVLNGVKLTA